MLQNQAIYEDYLLKHGRESCKLSIEEVCTITGIDEEKYSLMEAGVELINRADAGLLSALFNLNPHYLERNNMQLALLYSANDIVELKEQKIAALDKTITRNMNK